MRPCRSTVQCQWKGVQPSASTGVSLHSHTLHSRENLHFVPAIIRRGVPEIDWSRIWWTPPLTARQAWILESGQIEAFGMRALVSLTDHDDIEAGRQLRALGQSRHMPISVEWTFPFGSTFFHLGVHNLPAPRAESLWREMNAATLGADPARLSAALADVSGFPGVLVVFNHPVWDEKGIGKPRHMDEVGRFLRLQGHCIHGIEWNGLRPHSENRQAAELAIHWGKPVVSGGDRHGRAPNACINLTHARSFEDFVDEVRLEKSSHVLLLNQYREGCTHRIVHSVFDVLRQDPGHGLGWKNWNDRVFYLDDCGLSRPLSEVWGRRPPWPVAVFVRLVGLLEHGPVRSALRALLAEEEALG